MGKITVALKKGGVTLAKTNEPKIIYYVNELEDEFSSAVIEPKRIDENYKYCQDGIFKRFTHFFWYRIIATPIAFIYTKLAYRHKIVGKEKLKSYRRTGHFIYGNHTHNLCDAVIPSLISVPQDTYVIVHPANVSIPYVGRVTPSMGALPLPDGMAAYKNFIAAIERRIGEGHAVAIYPEAHIWPFYTGVRPFRDTSFYYPVKLGTPVFCFTNTYQKRKHGGKPRIVTYIDGPFFPDTALPQREQKRTLRDEVYGAMCERAKLSNLVLIEYKRKQDTNG